MKPLCICVYVFVWLWELNKKKLVVQERKSAIEVWQQCMPDKKEGKLCLKVEIHKKVKLPCAKYSSAINQTATYVLP